jgi:hypothetical protein
MIRGVREPRFDCMCVSQQILFSDTIFSKRPLSSERYECIYILCRFCFSFQKDHYVTQQAYVFCTTGVPKFFSNEGATSKFRMSELPYWAPFKYYAPPYVIQSHRQPGVLNWCNHCLWSFLKLIYCFTSVTYLLYEWLLHSDRLLFRRRHIQNLN